MDDCYRIALIGWVFSGVEIFIIWGLLYHFYYKKKLITQIIPILPFSSSQNTQTTPKLKFNGINNKNNNKNSNDLTSNFKIDNSLEQHQSLGNIGNSQVDVVRNLREMGKNIYKQQISHNSPNIKPNPMDTVVVKKF